MTDNNLDNDLTKLDKALAVPTFLVAFLFLLIAGFVIHIKSSGLLEVNLLLAWVYHACLYVLGLLYLYFVGELIAHWMSGGKNLGQHVWGLLFPFLRLCPQDHVDGSHVWVVGVDWHHKTPAFEKYLTRRFSAPMIAIALMVLPVVGAELMWNEAISQHTVWNFWLQTATGFIWMAFVFEFVVMITVVEKKLFYCRKNWIDIAIIILPFIAFMRAARLGRLLKLKQLSKTAKIWRARGVALRAWRAIVALEVLDKILRRDPSYQIDRLQIRIEEKEQEILQLRTEIEQLKKRNAERESMRRESQAT